MGDNADDFGNDCDVCGEPDTAICGHEQGKPYVSETDDYGEVVRCRSLEQAKQVLRDHEAMEARRGKHAGHGGPCAALILQEFFPEDEAGYILWNHTCFPMDCRTASRQAVEYIHERLKGEAPQDHEDPPP